MDIWYIMNTCTTTLKIFYDQNCIILVYMIWCGILVIEIINYYWYIITFNIVMSFETIFFILNDILLNFRYGNILYQMNLNHIIYDALPYTCRMICYCFI